VFFAGALLALLAVPVALTASVGSATASPATPSPIEAPLPTGVTSTNVGLNSVSCVASGACVATGYYVNSNGNAQGIIETLDGSTWSAQEAPAPTNTGDNFPDVECLPGPFCVAVGDYTAENGLNYPIIDTLSGTSWQIADISTPANSTGEVLQLDSVSCTSDTSCVAVGFYEDEPGTYNMLIYTLSGSNWTRTSGTVPANSGSPTTSYNTLGSVSCTSSTSCVAVGSYQVNPPGGPLAGLIETDSGGTWMGAPAAVPSNATTGGGALSGLNSVSCTADDSCVAFGSYSEGLGYPEGMIDDISGSTTPSAAEAQLPAGGYSGAYLISGACTGASTCIAVGDDDTYSKGFIDTLAGSSQASTQDSQGLQSVTCDSSTNCIAVGGEIDTLLGSTWTSQPDPTPDASGDSGAYLRSASCASDGSCVAIGSYTDPSSNNDGLIEEFNEPQPPTVQSCSPTAAGALAYAGTDPDATATCDVAGSAQITGQSLTIAAPASLSWSATVDGADQSLDVANAPITLEPIDATGTGDGWTVGVTSTTFSDGTNELPFNTLSVNGSVGAASDTTAPAAACDPSSTCSMPVDNDVSYPLPVPAEDTAPTAADLYDASAGSGLGAIDLTTDWWLNVPADVYAGNYDNTITLSIASGP
jgi:hypothetical protein